MTTILALQGSPRGKKGSTDIMLQQFFKGAQSAGAKTETIYLKNHKIHHCTGCYTCWTKTLGKCALKDDMTALLEKIKACDILVFVTPVYNHSMTSLTKAAMDRMLPLLDPHFVKSGNVYKHPSRYNRQFKTVLISSCGFPDMTQFEALRLNFRLREQLGNTKMIGELLMPSGGLLNKEVPLDFLKDNYDAFHNAGIEIMQDGHIHPETALMAQKLPFPPEDFFAMANAAWDQKLEESCSV